MLTAALIAAVSLAANTWTVDDNGPADFPSIAAAIPLVAPGDILLVMSGTYSAFTIDKPLILLGQPGTPKPFITAPIVIPAVASFTVAGFALAGVLASHVSGRLEIDDCTIQGASNQPALRIDTCPEALVSRTTISGDYTQLGAVVDHSTVTFVAGQINGGGGPDFVFPPANGELALLVVNGSRVLTAGTTIIGGWAGFNDSSQQGSSGGAIRATNFSTVQVRGLPTTLVSPGSASPFGTPGVCIESTTGSIVVTSGVKVTGSTATSSGGTLQSLTSAEPWIRVLGSDAPGHARTIECFGPNGAPAILFVALKPALLTSPLVDQPLWFDPSAIIAIRSFSTLGPTTALTIAVPIPVMPGIAGTTLELQAVFTTLYGTLAPNKYLGTNAANLIVRF